MRLKAINLLLHQQKNKNYWIKIKDEVIPEMLLASFLFANDQAFYVDIKKKLLALTYTLMFILN